MTFTSPGDPDFLHNPVDYDVLRDYANEIGGVYVAREREAATDAERRRWFEASLALQDEVAAVDPFSASQVTAKRAELLHRLRVLRGA